MIRSATASSTRCREVFPSAGFPPLGLEPEPELALVLDPELALVLDPGALARGMCLSWGVFLLRENVLSGPGRPRRRFGGNGGGAGRPSGLSQRQRSPFLGFRVSSTDWGNRARLRPSGAVAGNCVGEVSAAVLRMDCRVVPAGEFRGCGGGWPGGLGRLWGIEGNCVDCVGSRSGGGEDGLPGGPGGGVPGLRRGSAW